MELPTTNIINEITANESSPSISLYMPTHRSHPDNLQDPINFKNLLKQVESSLAQKYSQAEITEYLAPLEKLIGDTNVWNHTLDSIAILRSPEYLKILNLPIAVNELVVVADSFHTKPLRKFLQSQDRFHVLGLSLNKIQLFEGNRHSLTEIPLLSDIPKTLPEALGQDLTPQHSTVASYGGAATVGAVDMHHGDGGRKDQIDTDIEKFFRIISNEIQERYSKPSGLPLILASLPEHHHLFHQVSKNPHLLKNGIKLNPDSIKLEKLTELAWKIMEPEYLAKIDTLVRDFSQANVNNNGTDNIEEIAKAAITGRISTLLIESGRVISGQITDQELGTIKLDCLNHPEVDDLLDDIGEIVVRKGGKVMVIPSENMPTDSGIAATFRY
jgi:hypothetical protein